MANYLYSCRVCKYNTQELIKEVHLVAQDIVQASHVAHYYIFQEVMFPNQPIEISSITRVEGIDDVVNADMNVDEDEMSNEEDYDDEGEEDDPFDLSGIPGDNVMRLKHLCGQTLELANYQWKSVICPKCKQEVYRNEIQLDAGIYIFVPNQKRRNGKRKGL